MNTTRQRVKAEADYQYSNKFLKKQLKFTPRPDEVVVTFQPETSDLAARTLLKEARLPVTEGMDAGRGFAVLRTGAAPEVTDAAKALAGKPEVANTLPVMEDQEGLKRYFLPDELTVQFRKDIPPEQAERIIKEKGCSIMVRQRTPGYYTLGVPKDRGLFELLRQLSSMDEVLFAEPSEVGFDDALQYLPNDPDFPKLWGLHNTGQLVNGTAGKVDADIDLPEAWDYTRGDPEVIIAVIDTGADLNHPDLAANILPRGAEDWDFADAGDPSPDDTGGHGTHVAGTAASVDNDIGLIGVAPRCRLMPLRVNLTSGMNQNRADAINYVAAQAALNPNRRYVINCSWRMSGDHAGVHNAIINASSHNVVVVFAAGNNGANIDVTPQYPAVYPEVIATAATDQQDHRASFSNFGTKVDVAAPGVNIYSTYPDDTHTYLDGTSMAAPHVAGLAGLIWSRNRGLTAAQVRQIMESTCDNIDAANPGFTGLLGKGRVNARRAMLATPPPRLPFPVLRRMPFPQRNSGSSSGLSFARNYRVGLTLRPALIFLTQQPYSERVYFLNPSTGAVLGSMDPAANDTIGSLEWDGVNLRVANVTTGSGFINTINPYTGAQLGSIPVPAGRGEGLGWDGRYLYYSTITRVYVIAPTTGAVVRSFPPPGGSCRSLAYGNGWMFAGNSATGVITMFNPVTMIVKGTIMAPGAGTAKVEGLAFNPATSELFVANQSENTIYVGRVML